MPGDGPFVWIRDQASPYGFGHPPEGGMCVSTFLFVREGGKILLGTSADHPKWDALAGLDASRRRGNAGGSVLPASHVKFGEEPRAAPRRVGEEILEIPGRTYSEPRVEKDTYEARFAKGKVHDDIWFFADAIPPRSWGLRTPAWYTEHEWHDPKALPASAYARSHEDVVARWLAAGPSR